MQPRLYDIPQSAPEPRVGTIALLVKAIDSAGDAILIIDAEDRIVWANHAFSRLSGFSTEEILGAYRGAFLGGQAPGDSYQAMWHADAGCQGARRRESSGKRSDGSTYIVDETVSPLSDHGEAIAHFVCVLHDITEIRMAQQLERALADLDILTGLSGRAQILRLMERAVAEVAREGQILATLFIDLDGFKGINDAYGHHAGDAVLKAVAARLQSAVRHRDTVARFGGDEFVILLPKIAHQCAAKRLGQKIVDLVSQPVSIDSEYHSVSASVGIAFYPEHGTTCEGLLITADEAMYRAKRRGGSQFQIGGCITQPMRDVRFRQAGCNPDISVERVRGDGEGANPDSATKIFSKC